MTLEEMGALLRQERERLGISLEQAATEIKISKKYLVALEEGRTKELPHPVYAKGFVKNYAKLVGLDPEEMGRVLSNHYRADDDHVREAPQRLEPRDIPAPLKERKLSVPSIATGSGFRPSLWLGVPLLLVFGGLVWFFFFSNFKVSLPLEEFQKLFSSPEKAAQQPAPQAAPQAAPQSPTAPKPADSAKQAPQKPEAEAKPQPATGEGAPARDVLATGSSAPKAPAAQQSAAPGQDVSPAALAAEANFGTSGKQGVELNATQPARLEVTLEDGQTRTFSLLKGQRLALRFNDKVTVRFLNAGAVAAKLNGKDYPLEGGKLEGRTVTFP
ncbi:helix-turn-helix domain-containing protein [Fundidesulfovibrio agrisoli]|uniref:helix-turn-helix domain-containing protein n=1 Tax=Fundidesulfovibrio agrisoli TaxID=2922717 RepID=UPI001FAC3766|nr:helix-turn-helix domain-containing protein [Fundidesulfovibrio agrisoli]